MTRWWASGCITPSEPDLSARPRWNGSNANSKRGLLVIRQMTPEERRRYGPPKNPEGTTKRKRGYRLPPLPSPELDT